jgi:hypothetical protein
MRKRETMIGTAMTRTIPMACRSHRATRHTRIGGGSLSLRPRGT